jgi:hypothetical protein
MGCRSEFDRPASGPIEKFSTKPTKISLTTQEFLVPRNYLTPSGKDSPDERKLDWFGFRLYLPDFQGYTPDNLEYYAHQSGRLEQAIFVSTVREAAKTQMLDGKLVELPPTAWGEPAALFALHSRPSYELVRDEFGLQCYGPRSSTGAVYHSVCKGTRANGEMMVLIVDGEPSGLYVCRVNIYSAQERLQVRYDYSARNLHLWKQIDEAVWTKIRSWRQK